MVNLHVSELRSPDVDLDGEHMFTDSSEHDSRRCEGRTQRQGTMRVICMTLMIDSTLEAIIVYGAFVRYSITRRAVKMIRSTQLQTLVPICMIDRCEIRRTRHIRIPIAMWADEDGRRSQGMWLAGMYFQKYTPRSQMCRAPFAQH